MDEMYHHGILGQKWGVRRFQNKDGTLTAAGQKRLEKKDAKWAHRNHDKIVSKARKDVSKELDQYANQLLKNPSSVTSKGKISSSAINSYNRKMAELMNESVKNVTGTFGACRSIRCKTRRSWRAYGLWPTEAMICSS